MNREGQPWLTAGRDSWQQLQCPCQPPPAAALQSQLQQSTSAFLIWVKCAAAAASPMSNWKVAAKFYFYFDSSIERRLRLDFLHSSQPLKWFCVTINNKKEKF